MTVPDFPTFYGALHGRGPFAWQTRAARELSEFGWWQDVTAPTGAGKTTLVEAWLHALAVSGPGELPGHPARRLGRRLFWVVDRRAVVDQVFKHVQGVLDKITAPSAPPELAAVAAALREIGGGRDAVYALWRGGLDEAAGRDARAPLDPARVACVCSTVDQVGSRLLFRGFGIAPGSRAIQAGLVGMDATIVLDEAHIAEDFRATVKAVEKLQDGARRSPCRPTQLVAVTATPRSTTGFSLTDAERGEPAIAARLLARKLVSVAKSQRPHDVATIALELAHGHPHEAIGVVLNTVGDARAVFDELAAAGVGTDDRTLVIGPVRPLDRRAALARIPGRHERASRVEPFFVVATQTIEVGLDLDLDALVTACAPMPSLIQRLGRLDRTGARYLAGNPSCAIVLPPPRRGCPVYGDDTAAVFDWLRNRLGQGELDLGPAAIERLRDELPQPRDEPRPAPALLAFHVEALARTDALDSEVPEIELYLRGDRDTSPEVALMWRADIGADGDSVRDEASIAARVGDRLGTRPPHPGEMLTISLRAARRWLRGEAVGDVADISASAEADSEGAADHQPRPAWIVTRSGHASPEVVAVDLDASAARGGPRPGDLVVLAAGAGGADEFGWAPGSTNMVSDLGSLDRARPRVVFRTEQGDHAREIAHVRDALEAGELSASTAARELGRLLATALPSSDGYAEDVAEITRRFADDGHAELLADGELLLTTRPVPERRGGPAPEMTLSRHQEAVTERVAEIAAALGLDQPVADELSIAAAHHDEGKRDPRFQDWLSAGAVVVEPLAKSSYVATRARLRALREAAGWPRGKRHEIASALLVRRALPDAWLAAWLVATHHGANRPFARGVADPAANGIEISAPIAGIEAAVGAAELLDPGWQLEAFERLSAEYGAWGLACLEAILILADRELSGSGR